MVLKWYWITLTNGEKFLGSPRPLNNNPNILDVWYIDYAVIKSKYINANDVKLMVEINE